jgi:NAD+ kinase
VTSETRPPLIRQPTKRTHCIVHQFIESQRRAQVASSSESEPDSDRSNTVNGSKSEDNASTAHGQDISAQMGLDNTVDVKGRRLSRVDIIEASSPEESDAGQVDEQAWKSEMIKSVSEAELAAHNHEGLHSRLLTKKQLSEMAWGVRELSRRLSSMRIKFRAKTIFLLTKIYDQDLVPKTRALTKWLLSADRDVRYTIYVDDNLKDSTEFDAEGLLGELRSEHKAAGALDPNTNHDVMHKRLRYWNEEMCRTRPHMFDFVITLGGDGTVLYASWLFQRIVPPVLSFALGSLGFLTKFDFDEYKNILATAFSKGVTVSLRLRFEGTVMRSQKRKRSLADGTKQVEGDDEHRQRDLVEELVGEEKDDEHTHRPDGTYEILNEIVVDRGPNPSKYSCALSNLSAREFVRPALFPIISLFSLVIPSRACYLRHTHYEYNIMPSSFPLSFIMLYNLHSSRFMYLQYSFSSTLLLSSVFPAFSNMPLTCNILLCFAVYYSALRRTRLHACTSAPLAVKTFYLLCYAPNLELQTTLASNQP